MLVERGGELLARPRKLLLEVIRLEREGVPFILEGGEEGGDGCESGRARTDDA